MITVYNLSTDVSFYPKCFYNGTSAAFKEALDKDMRISLFFYNEELKTSTEVLVSTDLIVSAEIPCTFEQSAQLDKIPDNLILFPTCMFEPINGSNNSKHLN